MNNSKKTMMWTVLILLVILTGINIYNICTPNLYQEFNYLNVGGEENWEKLEKAFNTDAFKKSQRESLEQRIEMIKNPDQDNQQADPGTQLDEKEILDTLSKIKEDAHVYGKEDARFTIVEYSELVCPYCKRHSNDETLKKVLEELPEEVNVIHRSYLVHPSAQKLQEGWLCAKDQLTAEKHLTLIEKLFEEDSLNEDKLLEVAEGLGYDKDALSVCIDEGKYADLVAEQTQEGRDFGINGTPGHIIIDTKNGNSENVGGAYPVSKFVNVINNLKDRATE